MYRSIHPKFTMRRNSTRFVKLLVVGLATVLVTLFAYKAINSLFGDGEAPTDNPSAMRAIVDRLRGRAVDIHSNDAAPAGLAGFFSGRYKNVDHVKIDYHDYEFIEAEKNRDGIGEHGVPSKLPPSLEKNRKEIMLENGFDALLSDLISVNRSVIDIRPPGCAKIKYLAELPTVSVIVPFYNEHWSTLLRTCYSVLNRSPKNLIREIILVDDFSDKAFLKAKLDLYVAEHLPLVRIVRLAQREGLILARMAGARLATSDVLIFLDSHVEANTNWLPPLLEPIALNYKVCVCPFIDAISYENFEYRAQDEGARGAFDWEFYYKRLPLLPDDLAHPTRPFKSPVMAGGLFAISSKFFWELEGYDEGLDIWGGEQYELSFKIWMCGGEMYDAPCSRVGHIFRGPVVRKSSPRKTDYVHKNYKRVAEVWMDEYKEFLYQRTPILYSNIDAGNITAQLALRERLQCKSFKWFMENVAFDLPAMYPMVEPPNYAYGTLKSVSNPNLCVDSMGGHKIALFPCADTPTEPQKSQYFALTWHKDIRMRLYGPCLDVPTHRGDDEVIFYSCHGQQGNQGWKYHMDTQLISVGGNDRCLDMNAKLRKVFVNQCDASNPNMRWEWGFVNVTMMRDFDTSGAKHF